ncbi:MAG: acetyltransferase [Lachnospira sp.]|nr:acetyltransferase [Lachnospira sp.]
MVHEVYNLLVSCDGKNKYENIFFVDLHGDKDNKVISEEDFLKSDRKSSKILIAMGEPFMRKKIYEKYTAQGFELATFIHPLAVVLNDTVIGEGCIISPFSYIAQNVKVGKNVALNAGSIIENNCSIGDNCYINAKAFVGAKTIIEDTCFIGPGATLRDSLTIGRNSIIGTGAVVVKSVYEQSVCYGNPAVIVRENITNKVFK